MTLPVVEISAKDHVPPGMKALHLLPHLATTLGELKSLGSKKVFVLANNSSRKFIEGEDKLMGVLEKKGLLAAPLCTSIGMGGGEDGLLRAADEAYAAGADAVVTVGGGAVQDAGKLVRLWLSTRSDEGKVSDEKATVKAIQAASNRDPMPDLPPQVALPNSFAMAEATHVAGLTTNEGTKSGAAHPCLMPTVIVYDPALSAGLPDWVRFGTALRGIEHAVGAITHPKATDDVRDRALLGLRILNESLRQLVDEPEDPVLQCNVYVGGFIAIRALNAGCYPALGHLIENQYSARFGVHQGSCSGVLCARIMDYHCGDSLKQQESIAEALGGDGTVHAPRLVRDLVKILPGVADEHADAGVDDAKVREFAKWGFKTSLERYNALSPRKFVMVEDFYSMLVKPLGWIGDAHEY